MAGYSAAFLFLGTAALGAFLLLWIAMPETGRPSELTNRGRHSPLEETASECNAPVVG